MNKFFDHTLHLIGLLDVDGLVMRVNQAALTFAGVTEDQIRNQPFWDTPFWAHDPEQKTRIREAVRRAAGGETVRFETTHQDSGGHISVINFSIKPLYDENGRISFLIPEGRDITELRQAETSLKESETRYRTLFENAGDAILIMDGTRFSDCNTQALELFGCSRQDLIGQPPFRFSPLAQPDGCDSEKKARHYIEAALAGQPQFFQWSHARFDGTEFDAEVTLNAIRVGNSAFLQAIVRDITERKRAEKIRAENEERFRFLAENTKDVIWILDVETLRFTYVNPSVVRQRGFTPEEIMAQPLDEALDKASADYVRGLIAERMAAFAKGEEQLDQTVYYTKQLKQHHKNGSWIRTEATGSFRRNPSTGRLEIYGVTRDISERVSAEAEREKLGQQLRQAQKMEAIGTLAGGIAHDFNNILSVILGNTNLVLQDLDSRDRIHKKLSMVVKAGERAVDLIRQILTFSRREEKAKQSLYIHIIIKEIVKLLGPSLPKTIAIKTGLFADTLSVCGDPTEIHQVIMNLCTNAVYAMQQTGGELFIGLNPCSTPEDLQAGETDFPVTDPHFIELTVRDTGLGMSKEVLERVFEPFYTTKPREIGTGLGLWGVQGIVKRMGGTIEVLSNPGFGTLVRVILPTGETPRKEIPVVRDALPGGNERIMVVDDEAGIISFMTDFLTRLGYSVQAFTDSEKALAGFSRSPGGVDLLISDCIMPKINGFALVGKIRSLNPALPVILFTGSTEEKTRIAALKTGVQALLIKPLDAPALALEIRKALGHIHK
jgi:PAS domain S-box-containing protein